MIAWDESHGLKCPSGTGEPPLRLSQSPLIRGLEIGTISRLADLEIRATVIAPGRSQLSRTSIFISSELARSSGAYIPSARVGRALKVPGISARRR